jgi:hypothetical protein
MVREIWGRPSIDGDRGGVWRIRGIWGRRATTFHPRDRGVAGAADFGDLVAQGTRDVGGAEYLPRSFDGLAEACLAPPRSFAVCGRVRGISAAPSTPPRSFAVCGRVRGVPGADCGSWRGLRELARPSIYGDECVARPSIDGLRTAGEATFH